MLTYEWKLNIAVNEFCWCTIIKWKLIGIKRIFDRDAYWMIKAQKVCLLCLNFFIEFITLSIFILASHYWFLDTWKSVWDNEKGNTILYLCLVWINTILDYSGNEIQYANIEKFAEIIILIFDLSANFDALSYNRYVKKENRKVLFISRWYRL